MIVIGISLMICAINASLRDDLDQRNISTLRTVMQGILRSTEIHDVILVAHETLRKNWPDRVLRATSESVISFLPVRIVTSDVPLEFPTHQLATGRTLLIHVCPDHSDRINQYLDSILRITRWLTHEDHTPKLLFVFASGNKAANFEPLLRYMWNFEILHIAILELVTIDSSSILINVHQYNPFSEIYTMQDYSSNIIWFPDKLKNMYGYKLTISNNNNPPYDVSEKDSEGRFTLSSTSGHVFNTIAETMNFQIVVDQDSRDILDHLKDHSDRSRIDMMYSLFLIRASPLMFAHTFPVVQGRLCLVIPKILTKMTIFAPWKMIVTAMVGATIVIVFWLSSTILKFQSNLRHPINIISVMLSVPLPKGPSRFIEKIIFVSLVVASTRYTSMFYAEMVMFGVGQETELDIRDLKDLEKSGLGAVFTDLFYDVYVAENHELPAGLRGKVFKNSEVDKQSCLNWLIRYRNITCFMEETKAYMELRRNGRSVMKIAKFCSERYPVVYILRKGSPYVDKINVAMMRIVESDMWQKWLNDYLRVWTRKNRVTRADKVHATSTLGHMPVIVLFCMYLTPFLVFVGEIVVHRCRNGR